MVLILSKMPKGKVKRGRFVIQRHHLEFQKGKFEEKTGPTVLIYKGEHWAITQMQRRKHVSKGFLEAIRYWIDSVEKEAVELNNPK